MSMGFGYGRALRWAVVVLVMLAGAQAWAGDRKEICITFDEMPVAAGFDTATSVEVMVPIMYVLKEHHVKAAGFVLGQNLTGSYDLLGDWLNDGHRLGSMTYSQMDLNEAAEISVEAFKADIVAGQEAIEEMLEGFGQNSRYFRYPFLHYGPTPQSQRAVKKFLEDNSVIVAHVTILVDDYLYNLGFSKLGPQPSDAQLEGLMNEYVNHVLDQIEEAEDLAKAVVGRPVRQILQLRANRLNATFLDVMLTEIQKMGYDFVTLDRALGDEVYRKAQAYYGTKGVSYLEMIDRSDPDLLPAGE